MNPILDANSDEIASGDVLTCQLVDGNRSKIHCSDVTGKYFNIYSGNSVLVLNGVGFGSQKFKDGIKTLYVDTLFDSVIVSLHVDYFKFFVKCK